MLTVDPAHLVGAGGAAGAVLRHLVGQRVSSARFPAGTLTVNVVGSFALALVTFLGASHEAALLIGTGACGSFTTFSSFSVETVRLWETGERALAVANALGNLVGAGVAIGAAWLLAGSAAFVSFP